VRSSARDIDIFLIGVALALTGVVAIAAQPLAPAEPQRPNIVVIVADDLGFNDITRYGGGIADGRVPTPNIDSIAAQGVDFRNGYSGNATCAPSRAAIMTGRYPTRFGFEFTPTPRQFMKAVTGMAPADQLFKPVYHAEREAELIPYEDMGLPTGEITLARLLQGAGYHTVHLGKWHLGDPSTSSCGPPSLGPCASRTANPSSRPRT